MNAIRTFDALLAHNGHTLACEEYGDHNAIRATIDCVTCNTTLIDLGEEPDREERRDHLIENIGQLALSLGSGTSYSDFDNARDETAAALQDLGYTATGHAVG